MVVVKFIILILIFWTSCQIGMRIAGKYVVRANNLIQMKKALKILEAKITYTYDMLPDLFFDISNRIKGPVGNIFRNTAARMDVEFAGEAWECTIDDCDVFTEEDKDALKSLGKLLGSTDVQGQINQLNMVNCFLDEQIKEAIALKEKNTTMYRKLGVIIGLGITIVLI
ncbi:MAG: stage III sporulation protein AB [Clostridia bacterium]|nr:stage III sporulation protein AB [Clostridia bacterium]